MSLQPGYKLGAYEILEPIGKGGMGEVYRALDTKLRREVAVKVLPDSVARSSNRMHRFEQEARVVAALNHPNIATLYGVEEASGRPWLILELVEGETLEERLQRGRLELDVALRLFEQIAKGLEAAHRAGIVHRDLKPANVKIRSDGAVKILDFGIAKVLETDAPTADWHSPTRTKETAAGVVLGTAPYMSPEQARGEPVDKRTDIWAFGCCLYEALCGARAFPGNNAPDVTARILQSDADFGTLPAETPREVERLLRRCLARDAADRLHDIADARIEIRDVGQGGDGPIAAPAARMRWVVLSAVLAASCAAATVAWLTRADLPAPAPVVHAVSPFPSGAVLQPGFNPGVAISSDGRRIAYRVTREDQSEIYWRSLDEREARPVFGSEGSEMPFFSPDGEWLAFQRGNELLKIAVRGGAPSRLAEVGYMRGATWGDDGYIYYSGSQGQGLARVSENGGSAEQLTIPDRDNGEKTHRYPQKLPGRSAVLFTLGTGTIDLFDDAAIAVLDLDTREFEVVLDGGTNPHYSPSGHLVYGRRGELVAVAFDLETLRVTGGPVAVLSDVTSSPIAGNFEFDLASNGTLVYMSGEVSRDGRVVWIDPRGNKEPVMNDVDDYVFADVSPDGRFLATWVGRANNSIWVYELDRGTIVHRIQLFDCHFPLFEPRGRRVVFGSNLPGVVNLYWQASDGSTPIERLTTSRYDHLPRSWSPDGRWIAFEERRPESGLDLWILSVDGDREPRAYLVTRFDEQKPSFAPNGRWIAYQSNETGRDEIYVSAFPERGRRFQVSTTGGNSPEWNPSTGELLYVREDDVVAVRVRGDSELEIGAPRVVFPFDVPNPYAFATVRGFSVSPDGARIAVVEPGGRDGDPLTELQLVLNWDEELKRRAPMGGGS